jgi:hypothetical protein
MKELFLSFIKSGAEAADLITDPSQKSQAYAELAKAVALTGNVIYTSAPAEGKESLKKSASKKRKQEKEQPQELETVENADLELNQEIAYEEAQPEQTEQPELIEEVAVQEEQPPLQEEEEQEIDMGDSEDFTGPYAVIKARSYINSYADVYPEIMLEYFKKFTQNQYDSLDDVNDDNAVGFAVYIKSSVEQQQQ